MESVWRLRKADGWGVVRLGLERGGRGSGGESRREGMREEGVRRRIVEVGRDSGEVGKMAWRVDVNQSTRVCRGKTKGGDAAM